MSVVKSFWVAFWKKKTKAWWKGEEKCFDDPRNSDGVQVAIHFFLQRAIAAVDVAGMRGVAICDMNVDDGWWYNAVGSTVQRFQSVESEGREENNRFVKKGWKKKGPKQSSSVVNPKKRWGFCGDKS